LIVESGKLKVESEKLKVKSPSLRGAKGEKAIQRKHIEKERKETIVES